MATARRSRPKRKFAVLSTNDQPDDGSGFSDDLDGVAEGLRLTVPPCAHRVMAVFILMNQDGLAAAHFLAAQNKLRVADSLLQSLQRLVEDAYLALSIAAILDVLNPPTTSLQYSESFCGCIQTACLGFGTKQEGRSPESPANGFCSEKRGSFRIAFCCDQQAGSILARAWQPSVAAEVAATIPQNLYGLRFGRVPMQAVMPVEEMQRKVGHPECELMPFPLATCAMIF